MRVLAKPLPSMITFRSSSAWLATSSVCFSFSLLYLCSVAWDRSAQKKKGQRWQGFVQQKQKQQQRGSWKVCWCWWPYSLPPRRCFAGSHAPGCGASWPPAPFEAVRSPPGLAASVHAALRALPPGCWSGTWAGLCSVEPVRHIWDRGQNNLMRSGNVN